MNGIIKLFALVAATSLFTGCKLAVMVSSGGTVTSASRAMDCNGPKFCEFDISDAEFSETFTATPRTGYEFVKWQDGEAFLCANSTDPVCLVELPEGAAGASLAASSATASIRPIFRSLGGPLNNDGDGLPDDVDPDDDNDGVWDTIDDCPLEGPDIDGNGCPDSPIYLPETVLAGDKRWAQPNQFSERTWHEISSICPPPTGVCSGKLGYTDVTGWTWASSAEVAELINAFMGTSFSAAPEYAEFPDWSTLSPNIYNYFFSNDVEGAEYLYGWTRDEANIVEAYQFGARCAALSNDDCFNLTVGTREFGAALPKREPWGGAWLYRID